MLRFLWMPFCVLDKHGHKVSIEDLAVHQPEDHYVADAAIVQQIGQVCSEHNLGLRDYVYPSGKRWKEIDTDMASTVFHEEYDY